MIKINQDNLYFSDLRLKMSTPSRFLSRLIIYCVYTILTVGTAVFLISDVKWLFWTGILFLTFLVHRIIHIGRGEKNLSNLNKKKLVAGGYKKINITHYLSPSSLYCLEHALEKTTMVGGNFYLYLLKSLSEYQDIQEGLLRMDIKIKDFQERIDSSIEKDLKEKNNNFKSDLINKIENLSKIAFSISLEADEKFIEPRVFFSALNFINDEKINQIFNFFSISANDLQNSLIFGRFRRSFGWWSGVPQTLGSFAFHPRKIRHRIMNRAWTSRPTPTLDLYSNDFTDLAREEKIGFLIGHEKEYDRMVDILSRSTKPNVLLVGEAGSGKEAMIAHLAFEIIKDKVPSPLFDKRLVDLHIGNLISGASPDEVSKRINKIIEEINLAGNILLCIPDIHNLTKTSGPQYINAADILIPFITTDQFPLIGVSFPREFKEFIESQSNFASSFEVIRVEEINENDATRILTYDSVILEKQYKVIISFGAVKQAVILAHKYFRNKLLPGSAEDLLKEALADATQKGDKVLQADDIITVAERKTNVPIHRAGKEEVEKLLNLESIIHEKLIDQEQAVKAVSRSLREYRSGLSRKGGPIAVFLFVGPTGVGKTELSKILTKVQFGSENLMIRFDMSEYQDKQSIVRFIGSPDGKIAGSLTESILQKPYSLILLDEFEKTNPDILNLFLQVFDEGRLTDGIGRVIDFTNTIIIATSNAHSEFIKKNIEAGKKIEEISEELKRKLTDYFRPELINRFSDIIVFKSLSRDDTEAITRLQLKDLIKTVEEVQGVYLLFGEEAIKKIASLGYDPVFGARPLRGVISEKLRAVLAEKILKGEIVKGSSVNVILVGDGLNFVVN